MFNSRTKDRLNSLEAKMQTRVHETDFDNSYRMLGSKYAELKDKYNKLEDAMELLMNHFNIKFITVPEKTEIVSKDMK